jgi:hypothetical protein
VISSILILVISGALFAYWLKFVILMAADARSVERHAKHLAALVRLNFPAVQAELNQEQTVRLKKLYRDLDADYEMLTNLFRSTKTLVGIDDKLAMLGYRLAGLRFRVCTVLLGGQCSRCRKQALGEMSHMVQFLAGSMGAAYVEEAIGSAR